VVKRAGGEALNDDALCRGVLLPRQPQARLPLNT
jgi:hypothetical protein